MDSEKIVMIGFHWTWTKQSGGLQMGWSLKKVTNGTEVANEGASFHEMTMCLPEESSPTHGIYAVIGKDRQQIGENAPNSGFRECRSSHKLACYSGIICLSCQRGCPLHWNHFASLPKELLGFLKSAISDASYFPCQKTALRIFRRSATLESFCFFIAKDAPCLYWKHFCFLCRTGLSGEGIEVSLEPANLLLCQ